MAAAVRPACAITLEELSFPVLVYTRRADGGESVCAGRFQLRAIVEHVATHLEKEEDVNCPNCNQHMDGIRLDILQMSPSKREELHEMVGQPEVLALATKIANYFSDRGLVDGHPCPHELTLEQMRAMREELIHPIVPPDRGCEGGPPREEEEECIFDSCISKAGPVAIVAAAAFAVYSMVTFIFTPTDSGDKHKKNPSPPRGSIVSLEYLRV